MLTSHLEAMFQRRPAASCIRFVVLLDRAQANRLDADERRMRFDDFNEPVTRDQPPPDELCDERESVVGDDGEGT